MELAKHRGTRIVKAFGLLGLLIMWLGAAQAQTGGHIVELRTAYGTSFSVYQAGDQNAKRAVVLVHDRWGLSDNTLSWADQFAKQGYFVLAVDLFDGRRGLPGDGRAGELLMSQADPAASAANLRAAVRYLNRKSDRKTAVVGWGYGAMEALNITLLEPHAVISSVLFYGPPITDPEKLKPIRGPVLGVYSNRDTWAHPQLIEAFSWGMQQVRNSLSLIRVDAAPGFMDSTLAVYDEAETQRVMQRTLEFLDETLL